MSPEASGNGPSKIDHARTVLRAKRDATLQGAKDAASRVVIGSAKLGQATGRGIEHLLITGSRGMATVGELTVTYKVLPENYSSSSSIHRGHTKSVPASRVEQELGHKKSKLKKLSGGKIGRDTEAITRERIGLPIIIQIPVELAPDSNLEKAFKGSKLFVGKTVPGVGSFATEKKDSQGRKPKAIELVAYLEVAPVTPDDNYQHRLRFGLATVDVGKRQNLNSIKSISIKTSNSVGSNSQGINFPVEEVTVDDVAERIVSWVAESDARIKKDDVYDALKIAASLNIGVADFWKTVHANQGFETYMNLHPHVTAFALKLFLGSNDVRQASDALNGFFVDVAANKFKKFSNYVAGAREAVAQIDPSISLSINMGLGAIQNVMRLTNQSILNKQGSQQVIDRIRGQEGSTGEKQDELLISGDPLSIILMTPRFLTQIIDFTVKRYIPLVDETIKAHLTAAEEALKTTKSGAEAQAEFYRTVRHSFNQRLPQIHSELRRGGIKAADHAAQQVIEVLNTSADMTFGINPGMAIETEKKPNLVDGKVDGILKRIEEKKSVSTKSK